MLPSFVVVLLLLPSLFCCACSSSPASPDAAVEGGLDAGPDASLPDAGVSERLVFVSSDAVVGGDIGGVAGADAHCAGLASDAGLTGTFRAWLSTVGDSVADRLVHSSVPYRRLDGVQVADDWADLVDGTLDAPINVNEQASATGGDVWTGTQIDGSASTPNDCGGFTSTDGTGLCGASGSSSSAWTQNILPSCGISLRLYCVEE